MPTRFRDATDALGVRIVGGDLPAGTALTLDWVARETEVSRTIAREVVQVLASMGLVESRRRTGVTVLPRERWDVLAASVVRWRLEGEERLGHLAELSQLRAVVEPTACALAAQRADAELGRELVALAEGMEQAGAARDLPTFTELDVRFHRLLLEASGNSLFAGLRDLVEQVLRGRTSHRLMPHEPKPEARRLHSMVADAVARGDAEVARSAMTTICLEVAQDVAATAAAAAAAAAAADTAVG